jgi:CheY-like chemotaxis protein
MTSKNTILYAEDDADDIFMVTKAFEAHPDIEVVHAPDGREACSLLSGMLKKGTPPCLVILDINMPVMSGKEALIKMRELPGFDGIPVVLFSTSSSGADKKFAEDEKVELFTKPLNYSDLELIASAFVEKCNFHNNHTP